MAELEKEEKEKDWYYTQLQNLTKRIDSLPLTENVNKLTHRILWPSYRSMFTEVSLNTTIPMSPGCCCYGKSELM